MLKELTLLEGEDYLQTLKDTVDLCEPGKEAELQLEIARQHQASVEKRERTAHYLQDEEDRIKAGNKRLKEGRAFIAKRKADLEKFKKFLALGIKAMGTDKRGRYPTLKGLTTQLRIQKNPDTVLADMTMLPYQFQKTTIVVRRDLWQLLIDTCTAFEGEGEFIDRFEASVLHAPLLKEIKQHLDDQIEIPGTDIQFGEYGLRVGTPRRKKGEPEDDTE